MIASKRPRIVTSSSTSASPASIFLTTAASLAPSRLGRASSQFRRRGAGQAETDQIFRGHLLLRLVDAVEPIRLQDCVGLLVIDQQQSGLKRCESTLRANR